MHSTTASTPALPLRPELGLTRLRILRGGSERIEAHTRWVEPDREAEFESTARVNGEREESSGISRRSPAVTGKRPETLATKGTARALSPIPRASCPVTSPYTGALSSLRVAFPGHQSVAGPFFEGSACVLRIAGEQTSSDPLPDPTRKRGDTVRHRSTRGLVGGCEIGAWCVGMTMQDRASGPSL